MGLYLQGSSKNHFNVLALISQEGSAVLLREHMNPTTWTKAIEVTGHQTGDLKVIAVLELGSSGLGFLLWVMRGPQSRQAELFTQCLQLSAAEALFWLQCLHTSFYRFAGKSSSQRERVSLLTWYSVKSSDHTQLLLWGITLITLRYHWSSPFTVKYHHCGDY